VVPSSITIGALTSALALALAAAVVWAGLRQRIRPLPWALGLALIVGADLWINARPYWTYSTFDKTLFRADQIIERIKAGPSPTRVLDLGGIPAVRSPAYPGNLLMALDVPQLLGQHGLEMRYFDDVMGGSHEWRNIGNVHLWDMFAVRWVTTPTGMQGLDSIPGYMRVLQGVTTSSGAPTNLYERRTPVPYARVVPGAVSLDSASIISAVGDPRLAYDRIVLLDARDRVATPPVAQMPAASSARAAISHWEPGRMTIALEPVPTAASYLVVAENWSPDWRATVDNAPVKVLRGNWTLITVPVPAGAKGIELAYVSPAFRRGELLTLLSLLVALAAVVGPGVATRRRRSPPPTAAPSTPNA
jgi:hypothetical protein